MFWPYSDWLLILLSPAETDFAVLGAMCSLFPASHFWYAAIPAMGGGEGWQSPCSALASPSSDSPAAPLPLLWQLVWKLFLLHYHCGEWTLNFICVCIKLEELRAGRDLHRSSASCSEDQLCLYHSCYVNLIFSKRALIMELPDSLQIIYFRSYHPYIFQVSILSPVLLQEDLDRIFLPIQPRDRELIISMCLLRHFQWNQVLPELLCPSWKHICSRDLNSVGSRKNKLIYMSA